MVEIDGVRRQLERPIWQSGDLISDEWWRLIDLTTNSDAHSPIVLNGLASAIRRLNRNLQTTSFLLGETELADVYDDVAGQVNCINADRPVGTLDALMPDVSWGEASGLFKFANS